MSPCIEQEMKSQSRNYFEQAYEVCVEVGVQRSQSIRVFIDEIILCRFCNGEGKKHFDELKELGRDVFLKDPHFSVGSPKSEDDELDKLWVEFRQTLTKFYIASPPCYLHRKAGAAVAHRAGLSKRFRIEAMQLEQRSKGREEEWLELIVSGDIAGAKRYADNLVIKLSAELRELAIPELAHAPY